jgi:hypothetical protein
MVSEINQCTWDSETGTLVTKCKAESSKNEEELEKASWFKDAFAGLGIVANGGATKKHAPPPEALFDLDGESSIKTIHQRNEAQPSNAGTTPLTRNLLPCWEDKEGCALLLQSGKRNPPPLVMRMTAKHQVWPMADSYHQLPSLVHGEGTANSAKWIV